MIHVVRLRSGKVHSFNNFCYGIETWSKRPAQLKPDSGKKRYLFSEQAEERDPILIEGDSKAEILNWLKKASGVRFTIRGEKIEYDEEDFDTFMTSQLEAKTGAKA